MWLTVLLKPGVGRGGILVGSGGCCFLKSRYPGKGRGDSVFSPLSVPAQWFLGQHPGHFNHAPAQLLHLMRNLKPREGRGFAQGHQEIWWPCWDHDPSLWTPSSASETTREILPTVTSLVPILIPAARPAVGGEDLQLE